MAILSTFVDINVEKSGECQALEKEMRKKSMSSSDGCSRKRSEGGMGDAYKKDKMIFRKDIAFSDGRKHQNRWGKCLGQRRHIKKCVPVMCGKQKG